MRKRTLITLCAAALWAALKWAFDHFMWDWLTHYLETTFSVTVADVIATASGFVVPLVIVVGSIAAIYRIARQRPVPTEPQPDMRVSNAIDYIVNDSKATLSDPQKLSQPPWPSFLPAPAPGTRLMYSGVEHQDARKQVNSKLISGELRSWGLREIQAHIPNQFEHSLREILKEYWDDMQLDFQSCLYYKGSHSQTVKIPGRTERHHWAGMQISKQQIEQLWPKKSPALRLWTKIRRKPRIGHTSTVTVPETISYPPVPIEQPHAVIQIGSGEPFDHVEVNEYGVHRTVSVAVKNVDSGTITNCKFFRTFVSFTNDKEKVLLDGPFSLGPKESRYISIAMFNETKDLPHANHLIGLSMPPAAFGAGVMVPRLPPDRRHTVSFAVESLNTEVARLHCDLWVDENGKLRAGIV